jgi:nitrate/nitrite transporter NarK
VFLSCVYYLLTFAWVLGINTALAIFLTPPYNFRPKQIEFFYFTPVVAALIGEVVGHWLHDSIARICIKKHEGRFEPEVRLQAMWLSTLFILAGMIGLDSAYRMATILCSFRCFGDYMSLGS